MELGDQRAKDLADAAYKELGDQRAKDLVDAAYNEADVRRAIAMLHRALGYGRTGIYATKAYKVLGMRYEDLGDTAHAIEYYTKAIESGEPDGTIFLYRGQLHYDRGDWALARQDFAQALAVPPEAALFPDEQAVAMQYLADLEHTPENT